MSEISLPALAVRPPEQQPGPLDQFAKVTQLKSLLNAQQYQQQAQPLELQQKQAETQSAQLQLQQQQKQAQDQQTVMQTIAKHNGDIGAALPELASSVTPQTYMGLAKAHLETQTAVQKLTNEQLDTTAKQNDNLAGVVTQAQQLPPDQYLQSWPQIAQSAIEAQPKLKGQIDPNKPIPQQNLGQIQLGLQSQTQYLAQEKAKRDAADLALKQQHEAFEEKGGQPVDKQELNDWLAKNPGKGPAEFATWKAKQSPVAMVMGNQLGAPGAGSALDQAAERYSKDGTLPSGFAKSPGTIASIIKRSAELHPDQDIAANKATFAADSAALKKVQTQYDTMTGFENTALKNLDLFIEKAKAVPDLGARFANTPLRMITGKMIGDENQAALNAARITASREAAKVLSSATGAGVLSDSQAKEVDDIVNGNLPLPAMIKTVETLKQDMANRHQGYQDDIATIKQRIGAKPATTPTAQPAAPQPGGFDWSKMPEHK